MNENDSPRWDQSDIRHFVDYVEKLVGDPDLNGFDMVFGIGPSDDIRPVILHKARNLSQRAQKEIIAVRDFLEAEDFKFNPQIAQAIILLFHIGRKIGFAEAARDSFDSKMRRRQLEGGRKGADRAHGEKSTREHFREHACRKIEKLIAGGCPVGEALSLVAREVGKSPRTLEKWRRSSASYKPQKAGRKKNVPSPPTA